MFKLLSLLLLLLAASTAIGQSAVAHEVTNDEYTVLSSLIQSRFIDRGTKLLVIEGRTQFDDHMVTIPKEFENDLRTKITKNYTLQPRLHISAKYLLLTPAQSDAIFQRDLKEAWDIFRKRYDTGLLTFSRVGFNDTKTRAFVYVADVCGELCGNGYTFVLEKQKHGWKITDENRVWIS